MAQKNEETAGRRSLQGSRGGTSAASPSHSTRSPRRGQYPAHLSAVESDIVRRIGHARSATRRAKLGRLAAFLSIWQLWREAGRRIRGRGRDS